MSAQIEGLDGDLGFILRMKNGYIHFLEGYTEGVGSTVGLDLTKIKFTLVDSQKRYSS